LPKPCLRSIGAAPAHWRRRAIGSPSSQGFSPSRLSSARGLSVRRGARSAADAAVCEPCAGHGRSGTVSDRESLPVCLVDSRRSAPRAAKAEQQHPAEPRAIGHPRVAHDELKIALNRGEIRAHLIGLPEWQTVLGILGKPGPGGSRIRSPRCPATVLAFIAGPGVPNPRSLRRGGYRGGHAANRISLSS
jgi:hypothetical protein